MKLCWDDFSYDFKLGILYMATKQADDFINENIKHDLADKGNSRG